MPGILTGMCEPVHKRQKKICGWAAGAAGTTPGARGSTPSSRHKLLFCLEYRCQLCFARFWTVLTVRWYARTRTDRLRVAGAGVGSEGVQMLPWSLLPSVLVPMYLIVHGVIFAQLARTSGARGAEKFIGSRSMQPVNNGISGDTG